MKPLQDKGNNRDLHEKGNGGRKRRGLRLLLAIFILLLLAAAGTAAYVYGELQPVEANGQPAEKKITILPGSSVREIAGLLEEEGLIRNATLFTYYVQAKGVGSRLQAGDYSLQVGQTIDQLLNMLVDGKAIVNTVRFTIPEGWNVEQIANSLAEKGIVDKQKFLQEVNSGQFPEFPFVASIPKKEGRKYRLEGYLFPETYEVKKDATEHEIIAKMLAQFQKELKPEWLDTLQKRKMTLDDAVNLASIVEREVAVDKERPLVAGVYFNRLRENWPLQADATVQFALGGKQRDRITYADLEVDHPYNTYRNNGLPPGPIASPGRESLAAVILPATHDYFFYVTKKDGSSEHYFSKTLQEHNARDAQSRKN